MALRRSAWIYPVEVLEAGAAHAIDRARTAGVDRLRMAVVYHSARVLWEAPGGLRLWEPDDGGSYAQATSGRLPLATGLGERDPVAELRSGLNDAGMDLGLWVVLAHNRAVAGRSPHWQAITATGDPNPGTLCPSRPQVRRYVRDLVVDLVSAYSPASIDLESLGMPGWGPPFRLDIAGDSDDQRSALLGVCFCDACSDAAALADVDATEARQAILAVLRQGRVLAATDVALARELPAVASYLGVQRRTVVEFARDLRSATPATTKLVLPQFGSVDQAWNTGLDPQVFHHLDGLIVSGYSSTLAGALQHLQGWREAMPRADVGFELAIRSGREYLTPAALHELAAGAAASNIDGLVLYNLSLHSTEELRAIATAWN